MGIHWYIPLLAYTDWLSSQLILHASWLDGADRGYGPGSNFGACHVPVPVLIKKAFTRQK